MTILLVFVIALLGGCDGSGGNKTITLALSGVVGDCSGVRIEIPTSLRSERQSAATQCSAVGALAAADCDLEVRAESGRVILLATNCRQGRLANDEALWSCTGLANDVAAVQREASAICACGCSRTCAGEPVRVAACSGDCAIAKSPAEIAPVTQARAGATSTVFVAPTPTSTSTTYCGTCCDTFSVQNYGLQGQPQLSEVELEVTFAVPGCPPDPSCYSDNTSIRVVTRELASDASGRKFSVCLQNADGFAPQGLNFQCEVTGGDLLSEKLVRALTPDLEDVTAQVTVDKFAFARNEESMQ